MDPDLYGYLTYLISKRNEVFLKSANSFKKKYDNDISSIRTKNIPLRDRRIILFNLTRTYNSRIRVLMNQRRADINDIIQTTKTVPGKVYRRFALVIGIDYLDDPNRTLKGAAMDGMRMKKLLEGAGYIVTFLSDNSPNAILPTLNNLTQAIINLFQNKVAGDTLVFYFSGHATYINDTNGDELDGYDELITTIDPYDPISGNQTYITDDILKAIIQKELKTGIKVYCVMDACNSGTILDLKYNYFDGSPSGVTNNQYQSETNGQIYLLSSARDDELSGEALIDYGGGFTTYGGIFTYAFLDVLQSYPSTQLLSLKELLNLIRKKIIELGFSEQTAQLSSGKMINPDTTYFSLYF
jgi:hypothetical protein